MSGILYPLNHRGWKPVLSFHIPSLLPDPSTAPTIQAYRQRIGLDFNICVWCVCATLPYCNVVYTVVWAHVLHQTSVRIILPLERIRSPAAPLILTLARIMQRIRGRRNAKTQEPIRSVVGRVLARQWSLSATVPWSKRRRSR